MTISGISNGFFSVKMSAKQNAPHGVPLVNGAFLFIIFNL